MAYREYQETSEQAIPVTHDDRAFLHSYAAAAFVPITQASITALVIGVSTGVVLGVLGVPGWSKWALVAGVLTLAISWLSLQMRWLSLTSIERVIQFDINRDGHIGAAPADVREIIRVQVNETDTNGHITFKYADLPASDYQITTLATGLLNGLPLSERQWSGLGKPFSINEYRALRDEMIKRGLAYQVSEKDIRQGYDLTKAGRAVMKRFAPSPALMSDDVRDE